MLTIHFLRNYSYKEVQRFDYYSYSVILELVIENSKQVGIGHTKSKETSSKTLQKMTKL